MEGIDKTARPSRRHARPSKPTHRAADGHLQFAYHLLDQDTVPRHCVFVGSYAESVTVLCVVETGSSATLVAVLRPSLWESPP